MYLIDVGVGHDVGGTVDALPTDKASCLTLRQRGQSEEEQHKERSRRSHDSSMEINL